MFHHLSSIRSSVLALGVAGALLGGAATAFAGQRAPLRVTVTAPSDVLVERVTHADLNLAQAPARRLLMKRVGSAVHRVCSPGRFDGGLALSEQMGCEQAAWDEAKPQIALAVQRSTQLAQNGVTTLPEVALVVSAGQ